MAKAYPLAPVGSDARASVMVQTAGARMKKRAPAHRLSASSGVPTNPIELSAFVVADWLRKRCFVEIRSYFASFASRNAAQSYRRIPESANGT